MRGFSLNEGVKEWYLPSKRRYFDPVGSFSVKTAANEIGTHMLLIITSV